MAARPADNIIEPFAVSLLVQQCIVPTELSLTGARVTGRLTQLHIHAAATVLDDIFAVLRALLSSAADAKPQPAAPVPSSAPLSLPAGLMGDDEHERLGDAVLNEHEGGPPRELVAKNALRRSTLL